jgi:hypothetical protein
MSRAQWPLYKFRDASVRSHTLCVIQSCAAGELSASSLKEIWFREGYLNTHNPQHVVDMLLRGRGDLVEKLWQGGFTLMLPRPFYSRSLISDQEAHLYFRARTKPRRGGAKG